MAAEWLARQWLRLKGYRIVAVRERTPVGEIDLVARRGDQIAIVEVKARPALGASGAMPGPRQQARLAHAAAAFLGRHPHLAGLSVRFDVVTIVPWRRPRHLRDAWRP